MVAAVIGCGPSAIHWDPFKCERSFGVNDAIGKFPKFGFDHLIVVNGPHKFTNGRLATIINTPQFEFHTNAIGSWGQYFPNGKQIKITEFHDGIKVLRGHLIYHSKTSPIIAMSMAFNAGADHINVFGADFNDHPHFRKGMKEGDREIKLYAKFGELLDKQGCKVRVTKESALSAYFDTI